MRPWITCEGEVNWKLVDRLLTALVGLLLHFPCIRVDEVCHNMTPVLSKVETMILLEVKMYRQLFKSA